MPTQKRRYYSSSRRRHKIKSLVLPSKASSELLVEAAAPVSCTPPSFTKILKSMYQLNFLVLPKAFCDEHKVGNHVSMTDSTGHKVWDMRCHSRSSNRGMYRIGKKWGEFVFDHSLKIGDKLMFTLVSSSHFVVEFENSKGAICAMRPTRDGNSWRRRNTKVSWRGGSLKDEMVPGVAMADGELAMADGELAMADGELAMAVGELAMADGELAMAVGELAMATTYHVVPISSKQIMSPVREMFCQCKDSSEMHNKFLEFTHLECKYPDGTSYLQIFDSDSEVTEEGV